MEVATLLGLIGIGYGVAKLSNPNTNTNPNVNTNVNSNVNSKGYTNVNTKEGFQSKRPASYGFSPDLDQMYKLPSGQSYPSDSGRGPHGNAFGYATQKPPIAPRINPMDISPAPESLEAVRPSVAANVTGVEEDPDYISEDFVISPLTGQRMPSSEFKHNNMVPFFGGRVKQNVAPNTNNSLLDSFTGSGINQIKKKEVESMFNTAQTPFGNPYGLENSSEYVKNRIHTPMNRGGERPFEPVKVGPALGEEYGMTGKGGFQQMEINDIMRRSMPTTDKLRTANNPKLVYKTPVIPGQRFITSSPENPGEVRKYRPDTFHIDEGGERFIGAFSEEGQKETSRPIQTMKHQTRPETSTEAFGPAQSQDFNESYVTGAYRTPMAQQYGSSGFRNANMNDYFTKDVGGEAGDYGRNSIEMRPNERSSTGNRTMGLNLAPADMGQVPIHYNDDARPTRRSEMVGNIRQSGTATGYAHSAPSITVWDPSDVARTTVKETTIEWNYMGNASPASAPTKLKVYDPDDIAKPTQKSQLSAKSEYFGAGNATNKNFTSHDAANNMRLNPSKEKISKGRKPMAGNGNIGVFTGEKLGVTYKKLDADIINDRSLAVNNITGLPPGSGDIGRVKYRAPLKMDISAERNDRMFIASVEDNPLNQSLRKNAEADLAALGKAF